MTTKTPRQISSAPKAPTNQENVERLAREVDGIRADLGVLVGHLDRRRHTLTRKVPLALISVALVGLAFGGIALVVARQRRRQTLSSKLERLRAALVGIASNPERLGGGTGAAGQMASGAARAGGSVLAKHLAQTWLNREQAG